MVSPLSFSAGFLFYARFFFSYTPEFLHFSGMDKVRRLHFQHLKMLFVKIEKNQVHNIFHVPGEV